MAATIARATGFDRVRAKETHRLGSESSRATAATWRTFATAEVSKDGHGHIAVTRDGVTLHVFEFGPESGPLSAETAVELANEWAATR